MSKFEILAHCVFEFNTYTENVYTERLRGMRLVLSYALATDNFPL